VRFAEVLALDESAAIPDEWQQGRTLFGGLQAALALRAMRRLVPTDIPLRTLQASFIAPVPAGVVEIEARVLRVGKSTIHVEARLLEGGQTACLLLGIFGRARESVIRVTQVQSPPQRSIADSLEQPYLPGLTPAFTQYLQFRWALNAPYSGASEARTQVHVRLRDEAPVGEAQLIALADSIPSPGLSLLKKPAIASSLTWTLELLRNDYDPDPQGFWRMDAELSAAADGYLNQSAVLWSPDGRAIALSRQSVVAFA